MPKVLCNLRNASAEINGVKFEKTDDGMLSEDISKEVADSFGAIDGYLVIETEEKAPVKTGAKKAETQKAEETAQVQQP